MIEHAAAGVTSNVVGNRIDSELFDPKHEDSLAYLKDIAHEAMIQRVRTTYPINIGPTGPTGGWVGHARLRVSHLLVSGAPGDRLALQVSGSTLFDFINVTGTVMQIPLPILLDNGKAVAVVDLTNPGATTFTAWLFAWTE